MSVRALTFEIPPGTEASACRSCGSTVFWIVTKRGKRMPLDPNGESHFASCPEASSWRKPKTETQAPQSLRELWALPLEEQQRLRKHLPWGHLRALQLAKENAAPDFPKAGRFYLLKRQKTNETLVVDPLRPWNDAIIFEHADESVARAFAEQQSNKEEGNTHGQTGKDESVASREDRAREKESPKDSVGSFARERKAASHP